MMYAKTIIELPNLRIKPTGEHSVKTALTEREQFSRRKTDYFRNEEKVGPPGDPWKLGFEHKKSPIDLSAVRLAYQINFSCGDWVTDWWVITDVIYDSNPRILECSLREALPEGGSCMSLKVNRDNVAVEFFDQQTSPWSVRLEVGSESGSGFEALDLASPEQMEGPCTATIEVEVPPYPKVSAASQPVFVRLITSCTGEKIEPRAFTYLPSKESALNAQKEKDEKQKNDYISRMMENIEKPDFVAMVKKQAEKATPAITVLRPEREERVSKELPSYVSNEDHKKAAQKDILALIQRKR